MYSSCVTTVSLPFDTVYVKGKVGLQQHHVGGKLWKYSYQTQNFAEQWPFFLVGQRHFLRSGYHISIMRSSRTSLKISIKIMTNLIDAKGLEIEGAV
ncbi:hypothetical protein AB7101_10185 [Providencia rettgeri]